jgi:hypothetical protein
MSNKSRRLKKIIIKHTKLPACLINIIIRFNRCVKSTCPKCSTSKRAILKLGREFDSSLMYGAAGRTYLICPNCNYIYGSAM